MDIHQCLWLALSNGDGGSVASENPQPAALCGIATISSLTATATGAVVVAATAAAPAAFEVGGGGEALKREGGNVALENPHPEAAVTLTAST